VAAQLKLCGFLQFLQKNKGGNYITYTIYLPPFKFACHRVAIPCHYCGIQCQKGGISMPPYFYFCNNVANSLPPIKKTPRQSFGLPRLLEKWKFFKWWQLYYIYDIIATF